MNVIKTNCPVLLLFVILFVLAGCKKDDEDEVKPEPLIEWAQATTTRYIYSGGVLAEFQIVKDFYIINNASGEISVTASTGSSSKTEQFQVIYTSDYKIVISCPVSEPRGSSTLTVSSPNASKSFGINFTDCVVSVSSVKLE